MNELALFAGAGGGILGSKLLGWRTVCAVEWDAYARDVLVARQNDGCLEAFPVWDDVQTFDGHAWRGRVDVVSGGFPCQDISAAGKGAGITGARSGMWKHMARIIGEVRPQFVWVENSPMLVSRGLAVVLADLAALGFDARWGIVGAHHASAPHKRDRIWIAGWRDVFSHAELLGFGRRKQQSDGTKEATEGMADASSPQDDGVWRDRELGRNAVGWSEQAPLGEHGKANHDGVGGCGEALANPVRARLEGRELGRGHDTERRQEPHGSTAQCGEDVGDAVCRGLSVSQSQSIQERAKGGAIVGARPASSGWWATEPDVGRVAHELAGRLDGCGKGLQA